MTSLSTRLLVAGLAIAGASLASATEPPLDETEAISRVTDQDRQFWAFRPPVRPAIPQVKSNDRVRTPIDAFLLARLEEKELSFNGDAPKPVLLRRLCFDLLGLPPTPEQLDAFLADERPDAYERLVDQLLASQHYGERWGRHWLDIAGYADSDGYLDADRVRPEAWRYRDYVIQAHNDDLPFDQFVHEQLAGDELSDWRRADELTPDMVRQLTATGFLRTASDPTYPGYVEPNEVHQVIGDTMQIVGSALLGLTVQCARCHVHKYDPLSQRDYYALESIFLPALDPARWQPSPVRGIPLATEAEHARITQQNHQADDRIKVLSDSSKDLTNRYRKKLLITKLAESAAQNREGETQTGGRSSRRAGREEDAQREGEVPAKLKASAELIEKLADAAFTSPDKRTDEQKSLIAKHAPNLVLNDNDLATQFPEYQHEAGKVQAAIAAETAIKQSITLLRGLADLDDKPPQGRVLLRGDFDKPGALVEPGVPEVLVAAGYRLNVESAYKTTGRRLAFALWLTSPANPLTARVQINRMWGRHFGRGLVATQANFGHSGARPTHPELLNWLSTELVRCGWSMKALHRMMVTSTAYRQTSDIDATKAGADPENTLLGAWQPRRHEGEVMRDSVLAVSGKLNHQMFGPPVPVSSQADGSVVTSDDASGNRRSIYLIVRRSQHLTMLDLFDTPTMEINCPERSVSTVPLQALAMLHGPLTEGASTALAGRVLQSGTDDDARTGWVFRLLFAREPTDTERQAIRDFLAAVTREHLGDKPPADAAAQEAASKAAWIQTALVLLNNSEFVYVH